MRLGLFRGPWDGGHIAPDGALLDFGELQQSVEEVFTAELESDVQLVGLDLTDFLSGAMPARLAGLDRVLGVCGPFPALLMYLRARHGLDFSLVRGVHTLGWIGYAFQEFVAEQLARPHDSCLHVSHYSLARWKAVRQGQDDHFFYAQLNEPAPLRCGGRPAAIHCGFFSRISRDKGLAWTPAIVAKLLAAGWPVRSLVVCGAVLDEELLRSCAIQLQAMGVALRLLGPLPPAEALRVIRGVDVVLFPSLSSFEAAGRVVTEAYQFGKTVIASDYCSAHHLLTAPFRIPFRTAPPAEGPTDAPFLVGELDLESWRAPTWDEPCFVTEFCEQYRRDPRRTRGMALGEPAPADRAPPAPPAGALRMQFDWEGLPRRSAEAWCEAVLQRLPGACRGPQDLVDLGGTFKRSLIQCGFVPRVRFEQG